MRLKAPGSRPRRGSPPTHTFVSLTGPAGNIGDALIRRATLEWALGTSDALTVYTGNAPDAWLHQLGVPTGARVLRSKRSVARWLWLLATTRARPVLVFEAGEVPLDRGNGLRELVFLAETILVRIRRGVVVRPPRGIRAPSHPSLWLHAWAARLSQISLWRDRTSQELAHGGELVPDIGFAAGIRPGSDERDELVVSLRGRRELPSPDWFAAIRAFADAEGLRIRAVVQVHEDEERARAVARALDAAFDGWGHEDPLAHEHCLRRRYESARLVISDRLHVLILAALSGAVPVELVPRPTAKVGDAFATIGYGGLSLDAHARDPEELIRFLRTQTSRSDELRARTVAAAAELSAIEARVRESIRSARA